jgi:2-polyprenyl-3-methyl-5-hydroxy-6-metoxy-1,4-benzoquinol methylase
MLRVESPEFAGFDAVVFGEVLKHLVNPLELLTDCVEHVRWIITSSYPLPHSDEDCAYA